MKYEQSAADRYGRLSDGHEASMAVPAFLLGKNVEARKTNDAITTGAVDSGQQAGFAS